MSSPDDAISPDGPKPPALPTSALPLPTYHPPDPSKKSHARRQPAGHVPRPRNAFILFRCDFVRQKKVPLDVENDHRNISRIAGGVWREMREEDKRPWVEMAEREKERHARAYPGYRYSPVPGVVVGAVTRRKRGDLGEDEVGCGVEDGGEENVANRRIHWKKDDVYLPWPSTISSYIDLRRSSSCPPGAPRVPSVTDPSGPTTLLITRDDLARRPSRVTMYQSCSASSHSANPINPPHPSLAHVSTTTAALHERAFLGEKDNRPAFTTGGYASDTQIPGWDGSSAPAWGWEDAYGIDDLDIAPDTLPSAYAYMDAMHTRPHGLHPTFTNPFSPAVSTSTSTTQPLSFSLSGSGSSSDTSSTFSTSSPFSTPSPPPPALSKTSTKTNSITTTRSLLGGFTRMSLDDDDLSAMTVRDSHSHSGAGTRARQPPVGPIRIPVLVGQGKPEGEGAGAGRCA